MADDPIPVAGVDHVHLMKRRNTGKREDSITPNLLAIKKGSVKGGEVLGHGPGPQVFHLQGPLIKARERGGLRREDWKQRKRGSRKRS